ncbi:pseudouridylate synthase 7 homolog-like protein [Amblyraja radiata]|uniref:pseudouridylate synthase 7 homolog-like protein n=1 Tax=Amblyraja radiata TaxID=386614 RepID=UPI001403F2B2|nr:pseudouridylate synthase 7 homolog-like protein [Amblyraja radiata]
MYDMETVWCWVSDHVGFRGTIKNSPSDFVVTEIDMCGRLVNDVDCERDTCTIDSSQLQLQPQPRPTPSKRPKKRERSPANDSERAGVGESAVATVIPSDASHNTDPELSESSLNSPSVEVKGRSLEMLLGCSIAESLEQFASSAKGGSLAMEGKEEATLLLVTFQEKGQRASVHKAVRQRYPFLKTVTSSAEIRVRLDPQYSELRQLVSEGETDGLFRFLDSRDTSSKFSFQPDGNKEHRKAVHHFVSRYFGKLLETKSFSGQGDGSRRDAVITVRFRDKINGSRKRAAHEYQGPSTPYTAFTLHKVNMETLDAVASLASQLGVLPSDFSYAGIKDKKADTSQTMVVKNVTIDKLKAKQSSIQNKDLKIYNLRTTTQHLRVGQLKGNHFSIIVRNVSKHLKDDPEASLAERVFGAIENVKEKGFVNYYGPQRFGLGLNVQADQIGLALLKQNLVKALHLFFTPEEGNDPVNKAKRHFINTEDAKATLALMPEYKTRERLVLRALNRYGNSQEGCTRAWLSLPHYMRILYVHSYCSKIWNEAATFRLKTYDMHVVEGDLVTCDKPEQDLLSRNNQVHVVTAKDVESGNYSINQVVLPMPGNSIQYPSNKLTSWYQEALVRDGLQGCRFRIPALQLNVPGCYRPLLALPRRLECRWWESEEVLCTKEEAGFAVGEPDLPLKTGDALSLSFSLNPSNYATVCLREIMKCHV